MTKRKKIISLSLFIGAIIAVLVASFFLTQYVSNDEASQKLIQEFGYLAVLAISFIAGLNLFLPVPAATFVSIFTAGGMSLPAIIFLLIVGTMAANLLSFAIGHYGRHVTKSHYPKIQTWLTNLYTKHQKYLPYFVFGFTALVPLPDEVYLIPLGVIGIKLKIIIIPLLLGTIIYQTLAAYGIDNIFRFFLP
jgi:membrane protein YqaA with SNARE-associated domain